MTSAPSAGVSGDLWRGRGPDYKCRVTRISHSSHKQTAVHPTSYIRPAKMQIVRMTRQVSSIIKDKLRLLRHKGQVTVTRLTITEEELDNIANEALEAVIHCK